MDKLQDIVLFRFIWLHKEPFIKDQYDRVGIFCQRLSEVSVRSRFLKFHKEFGDAYVFCVIVLLTGFYTECTCHICLATASCSGNDKIAMICDLFACGQPFDKRIVQFTSRGIVDIQNVCFGLIKPCIVDKPFLAVVLTAVVFDIDQHSGGGGAVLD